MVATRKASTSLKSDHTAEDIIIDPEFRALMEAPTEEELETLEQNLIKDGRCLDPLVVWEGQNIILDGHNRIELCRKNQIKFEVTYLPFDNREACMRWILHHQQGQIMLRPPNQSIRDH